MIYKLLYLFVGKELRKSLLLFLKRLKMED